MISPDIALFWAGMALFSLFLLTRDDFLNRRKLGLSFWGVDDRRNYLMLGAGAMLFFLSSLPLVIKFVALFLNVYFFSVLNGKYFGLGEADVLAYNWLLNGWMFVYGSVQMWLVVSCIVYLGILLYFIYKRYFRLLYSDGKDPFFVFIFLTHVLLFVLFYIV